MTDKAADKADEKPVSVRELETVGDTDLTKVRTTIRPDLTIEVGPKELDDLRAMGLLVDDKKKGS